MIFLKASTASQEVLLGPFVDSTDGVTAETALSIANTDIKIFKAGATTLANKNSGGATHISAGNYYAVLDATDTDTVGSGSIVCQMSGALAVRVNFCVLPALVYDSLIGGTDNLQVDTTQAAGTAWGSGAITAASLAADAATEIRDKIIERTCLRGTVSGTPSTTSIPTSAMSPATSVADQVKGRIVIFDHDTTTAALRGQATDITASTSSATPTLTVTALTTAPVSGDTFTIV